METFFTKATLNKIKWCYILIVILLSLKIQAQTDIENKFRLAQSYEEVGKLENAESILRELVSLQPWNYSYFDALNRLLIKQKKFLESIQLIEEKINQTPQDINLYGLLGSTYFMVDNIPKAYEAWERGIKTNPNSIISYRVIANYAIESRAFDKAIDILERGKKISNDTEIFSLDLANIYSVNMRFAEAAKEYCELLLKNPEQIGNVKIKFNSYLENRSAIEQMIEIVNEKINEKPMPVLYDLLSYAYTLIGDYERSFQTVIEYENKTKGNGNMIFSFAQDAYRNKKYDVASKAYSYLIKNYSSSNLLPIYKFNYASTLEAFYNEKYLKEIDTWKPYDQPKLVFQEDYNQIIKTYEQLIKEYPNNSVYPQALFRMAEIYFNHLYDYRKADSLYTLVNLQASNSDLSVLAFLRRGKIAILISQLDKAKSNFEKVLLNNRSNVNNKAETNYYLARIEFWLGNFNESLKKLSEVTKNLSVDFANDALELSSLISIVKKDSLNLLRYAHADLLSFQYKFKEAADEFKSLADNPDLFILNEFSRYKFAEMLIALNDLPTALKVLELISENSKTGIFSDKSLFLLSKVYHFGIKDKIKAAQYYQKLLEKFPNSLYFELTREYLSNLQTNNG